MADEIIRGYRILGDRPKERQLAMDYIHQRPEAVSLHTPLTLAAVNQKANCLDRPEDFAVGSEDGGDDLPTDREAQLLCSGCPVIQQCREYAETAHVAYGVWGGTVRGRGLEAAMNDEEDA